MVMFIVYRTVLTQDRDVEGAEVFARRITDVMFIDPKVEGWANDVVYPFPGRWRTPLGEVRVSLQSVSSVVTSMRRDRVVQHFDLGFQRAGREGEDVIPQTSHHSPNRKQP